MTFCTRILTLIAGMLVAFGALTACDSDTSDPQSETYIAQLPAPQGQPPMVLAVSIQGDQVAAYACNNTNDEAWFFGTRKDGAIDLTSLFQDRLQATADCENLNITLTMNDVPLTGTAAKVEPPAGMYTATAGDARASWIVLPDQSVVGVVSANSKNDREVIDAINKQQQDFKDKVRQARLDRQLQQAAALTSGSWTSQLSGQSVTAVSVTGANTELPTTN